MASSRPGRSSCPVSSWLRWPCSSAPAPRPGSDAEARAPLVTHPPRPWPGSGGRPPCPWGSARRWPSAPGQGGSRLPARQALVGAAVGVLGVVATITLNAGLTDALDHPERAGVAWDVGGIVSGEGLQPDGVVPRAARRRSRPRHGVAATGDDRPSGPARRRRRRADLRRPPAPGGRRVADRPGPDIWSGPGRAPTRPPSGRPPPPTSASAWATRSRSARPTSG